MLYICFEKAAAKEPKDSNTRVCRCTDKEGQKVPKRFPETLQLAAVREITEMAKKSGLLSKTTELFDVSLFPPKKS